MAKKKVKKPVQETGKPVVEPRSARALSKFLRIAPRKMRLVVDTVRRVPTGRAFRTLMTLRKKAARMVEKVLKSAVANAKNLGLDEKKLFISDIRADGGPTMKRHMQRSMGRVEVNLKRTTHLSVTVKESSRTVNEPQSVSERQEAAGSWAAAVEKSKSGKKAAANA